MIDDVRLRPALPDDIPTILGLVRELAEFERDPDSAVATAELMYDALFGPRAVAHVLMAEGDAETYGFALYFFNFSTWTGRRGLHLEDFFVRSNARGRGVGVKIFRRLARIALQTGCGRLELSVLNWNVNAIRFYEKLDGIPMSDWTQYRYEVDTIAKIAALDEIPEIT